MRYVAAAFCLVSFVAYAQPEPPRARPPRSCVDTRQSPDYVPGVDVQGRAVAPADLPSDGDLGVNTRVFAEVRTPNRQVPSVGVEIDASGLDPKPPCPVAPEAPRPPEPAR